MRGEDRGLRWHLQSHDEFRLSPYAVPLAQALVEGGLPCAEVTFRTAAAEESIRLMNEKFPEMLVGAGTVLTTEQVDAAVKAGAFDKIKELTAEARNLVESIRK